MRVFEDILDRVNLGDGCLGCFKLADDFIGVALTLWIGGIPISIMVFLGLIILAGIVVNNAILILHQRNNFVAEGLDAASALEQASRSRLRPILMTNFAALLGALPLVLASGEGVEMRRPLGLAIVGGLSVSQLLTLYTVPVVYLWLDRVRLRFQRTPAAPAVREAAA